MTERLYGGGEPTVRKLNKNGFTLVEVTVTLAVFAILVALASSIVVSGGNIYAKNANTVKAAQVCDGVYDVLNNRLSFATSIDFTKASAEKSPDSYSECIKIAKKSDEPPVSINREGRKNDDGTFIFDEVCDTGAFDITVSFKKEEIKYANNSKNPMTVLPFEVEVFSSEGEPVYSRKCIIELLNIKSDDHIKMDDNLYTNENDLYINYTLAQ